MCFICSRFFFFTLYQVIPLKCQIVAFIEKLANRETMRFPLAFVVFLFNKTINNGQAVSRSYANAIVYSMST